MNSPEISLATIETAAKAYSADHAALSETVAELNCEIEKLKRHYLPAIKRRVAKAAETRSALSDLVDASRDLFIRPRTVIFHGIKVGLRKIAGGIIWEDSSHVVALIKAHYPKAQADLLIKTTETPIAKAIEDLTDAEIKQIGCTTFDAKDNIVITPADTEVDKIVTALLADAIEPEQQSAA
jgi:hypothetical protein